MGLTARMERRVLQGPPVPKEQRVRRVLRAYRDLLVRKVLRVRRERWGNRVPRDLKGRRDLREQRDQPDLRARRDPQERFDYTMAKGMSLAPSSLSISIVAMCSDTWSPSTKNSVPLFDLR